MKIEICCGILFFYDYALFDKNVIGIFAMKYYTQISCTDILPEAEFKKFEPRLKFQSRLKYGWFRPLKINVFKV